MGHGQFFATDGHSGIFNQGTALPEMDLIYVPQTLIDDYGVNAGDGDTITATGKVIDIGGGLRSTGVITDYLDVTPDAGGDIIIRHTGGPNSNPALEHTRSVNPGEFFFPNRTAGTIAVATESNFQPTTFTDFFVFKRKTGTTGNCGLWGWRNNVASPTGGLVRVEESGGTHTLKFYWLDNTNSYQSLSFVISVNTWYICAIHHTGTAARLWVNNLYASPDGENASTTYLPNVSSSSNSDETFQIGNDGSTDTGAEEIFWAEFRRKNGVLTQPEFDAIMNDLATIHAITLS